MLSKLLKTGLKSMAKKKLKPDAKQTLVKLRMIKDLISAGKDVSKQPPSLVRRAREELSSELKGVQKAKLKGESFDFINPKGRVE